LQYNVDINIRLFVCERAENYNQQYAHGKRIA
jgi:hypothetical protein